MNGVVSVQNLHVKAREHAETQVKLHVQLEDIVASMHASQRGGINYFRYRNSSTLTGKRRKQAGERLRLVWTAFQVNGVRRVRA